jgi:archaellum biogenesis protein FlaJ (TadC family)
MTKHFVKIKCYTVFHCENARIAKNLSVRLDQRVIYVYSRIFSVIVKVLLIATTPVERGRILCLVMRREERGCVGL